MSDDHSKKDQVETAGAEDTEAILSRRDFLIKSGLATAGVAVVGCGEKQTQKPQPCLDVRPTQDAGAARPCLKVRAQQDAGAARPCLKVKPPPPQPCLSPKPPPRPKPAPCLSVPAPKKP